MYSIFFIFLVINNLPTGLLGQADEIESPDVISNDQEVETMTERGFFQLLGAILKSSNNTINTSILLDHVDLDGDGTDENNDANGPLFTDYDFMKIFKSMGPVDTNLESQDDSDEETNEIFADLTGEDDSSGDSSDPDKLIESLVRMFDGKMQQEKYEQIWSKPSHDTKFQRMDDTFDWDTKYDWWIIFTVICSIGAMVTLFCAATTRKRLRGSKLPLHHDKRSKHFS